MDFSNPNINHQKNNNQYNKNNQKTKNMKTVETIRKEIEAVNAKLANPAIKESDKEKHTETLEKLSAELEEAIDRETLPTNIEIDSINISAIELDAILKPYYKPNTIVGVVVQCNAAEGVATGYKVQVMVAMLGGKRDFNEKQRLTRQTFWFVSYEPYGIGDIFETNAKRVIVCHSNYEKDGEPRMSKWFDRLKSIYDGNALKQGYSLVLNKDLDQKGVLMTSIQGNELFTVETYSRGE